MKLLSYNLYGVKDTNFPIPKWENRIKNIEKILHMLLSDDAIKVCCFQEVNETNIELLTYLLKNHKFQILDKFPMKTESFDQYNLVAIKEEDSLRNIAVTCIPHGTDFAYKPVKEQNIDYGMSDYRTTVFVSFEYQMHSYLIGNIHTDYISTEGKIKGTIKSLNYMDCMSAEYKLLVGDMNMVSHMSEVYSILKQKQNYTTLSRNKQFDVSDNSWHGYGTKEQVNVDFAFLETNISDQVEYKIIKQNNIFDEGSDHRPILLEFL